MKIFKTFLFAWLVTFFICAKAQKNSSTSLFNGKNLKGWYVDVPTMDSTDAKSPFFVRDGKLVSLGTRGGHLITEKVFSNYRVTFNYRFVAKPGNCGALVHVSKMRRLYEMFPQSIEVQLMHENAGDFWCIGENIEVPNMEERRGPKENWGVDGKKNRRIPNLLDNVEKPLGQWNRMQVECLGNEIKVWLNGRLINYGFNATASSGQFALQSEGAEVEFEEIMLKKIKVLSE